MRTLPDSAKASAAKRRRTRDIGDVSNWNDYDSYLEPVPWLLKDLRATEAETLCPDSAKKLTDTFLPANTCEKESLLSSIHVQWMSKEWLGSRKQQTAHGGN
jgi:hypothetical protein